MNFIIMNDYPFPDLKTGFLLTGDNVDVLAYTQLHFLQLFWPSQHKTNVKGGKVPLHFSEMEQVFLKKGNVKTNLADLDFIGYLL